MSDVPAGAAMVQLRLYVIAGAPNSSAAQKNLDTILAEIGADRFTVEIVDCIAEPMRALTEGVVVTPTLVKISPEPTRTIVGSLSDRASVTEILRLALPPAGASR